MVSPRKMWFIMIALTILAAVCHIHAYDLYNLAPALAVVLVFWAIATAKES